MKPDRVVVVCDVPRRRDCLNTLFAPFLRTEHPFWYESQRRRDAEVTWPMPCWREDLSSTRWPTYAESMGADITRRPPRISGMMHASVFIRIFCAGYGGSCFEANETVFVLNSSRWSPPSRSRRCSWCSAFQGVVEAMVPQGSVGAGIRSGDREA